MTEEQKYIIKTVDTTYLDKLVARQKKDEHLRLISRAINPELEQVVLKTDLFEEVDTATSLVDSLGIKFLYGIDVSASVVDKAREFFVAKEIAGEVSQADVRNLIFKDDFFDAVISTSTLDHFESKEEIYSSLDEIKRVLKPGGRLLITLDNPHNPTYYLLKILSFLNVTPYYIGKTLSMKELNTYLTEIGFTVSLNTVIIHNPRIISTLLFKGLRCLFGNNILADRLIGFFLKIFEFCGTTFLAKYTGCFIATEAVLKRPT